MTTDPQAKIGLAWIRPLGSEKNYAGNEACRQCHANEFKGHANSPHAHSVALIPDGQERPEFGSKQTVIDPVTNIRYAVQKSGGKNQILASAGDVHAAGTAKWIFGSGTQAYTYLAQTDQRYGQLRLTYYPPSKEWNFTPGSDPGARMQSPLGDRYNAAQAASCFGCHTTVLPGTPERLDLEHARLGVGCESCHGPCRKHVDSMLHPVALTSREGSDPNAKPVLLGPNDGPKVMQLCGQCHRITVAAENEEQMASAQLARFPGQALPRSKCFTASAGKLSCITCHDPHLSTKAQGIASFDSKCITCHTAPTGIPCSKNQRSNCVQCHMPAEKIARRLPLTFHNHWIRRDPTQ